MLIEKRIKGDNQWRTITLLELVEDIRVDLGHLVDPVTVLYLSLSINLNRKHETERAEYRII